MEWGKNKVGFYCSGDACIQMLQYPHAAIDSLGLALRTKHKTLSARSHGATATSNCHKLSQNL